MTQKDYVLFADMRRRIPSEAERLQFANHLIRVLSGDNGRFKEDTFRRAANCEVDKDGCFVAQDKVLADR